MSHLAIIPDGNRRWAKINGLLPHQGHKKGAENIMDITKACIEKGVGYLTIYILSAENIAKRSKEEVTHLFNYIEYYLSDKNLNKMDEEGIELNVFGDLSSLPRKLQEKIKAIKKNENAKITLSLAIGYGARQDIVNAVNAMVEKGAVATQDSFEKHLSTHDLPSVDLLIRCGGEQRISNFLLWELSYAEIYFEKKFWPDFKKLDLYKIIDYYLEVDRRYGK